MFSPLGGPKAVMSRARDNRHACLHVQVSFNFAFALISTSLFVGYMDGIAAVLLN